MKGRYTTELHNIVTRIIFYDSGVSYIVELQDVLHLVTLTSSLRLHHCTFRAIPAGGFILKIFEDVTVTLEQKYEVVLFSK
jgi:hypothetical protein